MMGASYVKFAALLLVDILVLGRYYQLLDGQTCSKVQDHFAKDCTCSLATERGDIL